MTPEGVTFISPGQRPGHLFEYMAQVPANRIGYRVLPAYQLKVIQECITLIVFIVFSALWLGEGLWLRYLLSFALILSGAAVAFL